MKERSRPLTIVVAATIALAFAPPCVAQQPSGVARDSAAIVQLEREWIGNRDSVALERILAPDFQHPVPQGEVLDKKTNIAWLVHHPVPPGVKIQFASLSVRTYGDAAVAIGVVRATNASGAELSNNFFTDVFIRRDGRWQAVSAQETDIIAQKR